MPARHSLFVSVPTVAVILLALAACVPVDDAEPGATGSPSPTATASPSATPTPGPSLPATGIPVTITCDQLVSAQAMYDFNPNFSLVADYTPAAASLAAEAVEQNGIACSWVNQTSGETIDIAVAQLPDSELTTLKNDLVTSSNSVPTYDVEGYFEFDGSVGVAQVFPDPYWVTVVSTTFFEPGDAQPLAAAAIAALG